MADNRGYNLIWLTQGENISKSQILDNTWLLIHELVQNDVSVGWIWSWYLEGS